MADPNLPPISARERFIRSFGYAFRGVVTLLVTQGNARVHAVASVIVIGLGWWLKISAGEWCAAVLAMGLVFTAEALNTAIEAAVDLASPELHPLAGRAKDVAAGAVLCAAIAAAIVGAIIFLPKLLALVS